MVWHCSETQFVVALQITHRKEKDFIAIIMKEIIAGFDTHPTFSEALI